MQKLIWISAIAALLASGCEGSAQVTAKTPNQTDDDAVAAAEPSEPKAESVAAPPVATEYFGVARNLSLTPLQREPVCQCLAAAVGPATSDNFDWHGSKVPAVGADGLVVAIGPSGTNCPTDSTSPSIKGVTRNGSDILIEVEEYQPGHRPPAMGAIVQNPGQTGGVYVVVHKASRYGKPLGGGPAKGPAMCKIGNGAGNDVAPPPPDPDEKP